MTTLYGNARANTLTTGEEDDLLVGRAGNDLLHSSGGNDTVYGGRGRDSIYGEDGNDLLFGDRGNDYLVGGPGSDTVYGGAGNDTLRCSSNTDSDYLFGGSGTDLFQFVTADPNGSVNGSISFIEDFELGTDRLDLDNWRPQRITNVPALDYPVAAAIEAWDPANSKQMVVWFEGVHPQDLENYIISKKGSWYEFVFDPTL